MKKFFPLILTFFLLFSSWAFAQDEKTLLEKALSLVEEGSIEGAQAILEEARLILWNKAPLKIANCLFVEE